MSRYRISQVPEHCGVPASTLLDVEMPGYALLQFIQQGRQVVVAEAGVVDDDVRGQDR